MNDDPINILLVDDEPKNLDALEAVLENPGYRLIRAASADEALLELVAKEFALLVLDIQMPGMNGFELAQMIKQRKKTAEVPIIFLTAFYSEDEHVLEGYSTGAVDFLHKPINAVVLRSKVAVFAELHRKTREIALANRTLSTEVTDRRRAQEQLRELNETLEQRVIERTGALRESEGRKNAILQLALDAIITIDHEGKFVEFNPAAEKIFGHTRLDVLGKSLADIIIPERLRERHKQGMKHYLATGEGPVLNQQIELPALRADGTEFPAELAIILIPDTHPPLFTAFLRDVTERKQTEETLTRRAEALVRADRNKDEFLAMLAHELRNPLAPLRSAAEILRTAEASAEEREYAQRILGHQIENMSRMIEDLLDVARITEGRIELRLQPVALEAILASVASFARFGCITQGQKFELSLPSEPVFLNADAIRLEQVFGNLLMNASKYSGTGSQICLSAEREAGTDPPLVIISVRDDGQGIAPELLPSVFDLFVQASRTLDRSHGGLGIGLTLVQRLVKMHGGSVEAHSEGLGHGSEFIVRLPILSEAPSASASASAFAVETPRRILIVDDNTDSARSIAMLQSRRGHETRTAFTGQDAVAVAGEFLPEVVLLDIGLPGIDGFEVARRIRAMPALSGIFIVAMSGYGRDEDRAEARLAGFDEYLVKPVDIERIREWIQTRI